MFFWLTIENTFYLLSNIIASVTILCAFWLFLIIRNETQKWEQRGLEVFRKRYSFVGWFQWIPCILFSGMSVGKIDSGSLFWSFLLITYSLENKFMSGIGAYWYFIECIILEVLNVIWSVNFNIFRLLKILSVCLLYSDAAIFLIAFFCILIFFCIFCIL